MRDRNQAILRGSIRLESDSCDPAPPTYRKDMRAAVSIKDARATLRLDIRSLIEIISWPFRASCRIHLHWVHQKC